MACPLCPYSALCGLDRNIAMEAALHVWESFYCDGNFRRCERFQLRQTGREVPARLLPNGRLLDVPDGSDPVPSGSNRLSRLPPEPRHPR
jgi:hypothetical protein